MNFKRPLREEYDTDEDFQEALDLYEWAVTDYEDQYHDRRQRD